MIRRVLALLVSAVVAAGVSMVAPVDPVAAVGWTRHGLPGGSLGYYYVTPAATPDACVSLAALGEGWAMEYMVFEDGTGRIWGKIEDRTADGRPVCANITPGATRARVGLVAWGGPSGTHHVWELVFAYEGWSKRHPWYAAGSWGQPPVLPGSSGFQTRNLTFASCSVSVSVPTTYTARLRTNNNFCAKVQACGWVPIAGPTRTPYCREREWPASNTVVIADTPKAMCYATFTLWTFKAGGQPGAQNTWIMWPTGEILNIGSMN